MATTLQSSIKKYANADATKYALFLSGPSTTNKALAQYDPLKTGYVRLFCTQMPKFLELLLPDETKRFKHFIETAFTSVQGLGNVSMDFEALTGGYAGLSFEIPTLAKDETTAITISLYEQAGSPIREYVTMWITGIADKQTGIGHYHGALDNTSWNLAYNQANHTMEMFYVSTDPTGRATGIEYACLFTNMVPKNIKVDQFNYESGQVQSVKYDLEFTVTKYESTQINMIAKKLMEKYVVRQNYLNFNSGYTVADVDAMRPYEMLDADMTQNGN